ncbi:MAG: DUF423 domain-containing protein [Sphingobacteriaceae bacterium]|nr:DUF423 domain-containing protein [Sphingobacteriaceae bacterium]
MNSKKLTFIGLLGAIAVALGALGAHFLKSKLPTGLITQEQLIGFDTAVKYQMYHTLAMLALILLSKHTTHKFINWAYNCFFIGILMFSGSLYFLCTRNLFGAEWLKVLGPITPIGGLFFIAGWILIILVGFSSNKKD